ncbi:MAG: amidohydrolase family protein [Leptospirales bacterium]|jgi:N-acyl-D-aspartate/D-glutamate deacylase
MQYDTLIRNGLFFDGSGAPGRLCDLYLKDGRLAKIAPRGAADEGSGAAATDQGDDSALRIIDAEGRWVTPGFIDFHTHYDAEIEAQPELSESLRHGVTTVALGSCSLSLALGTPEDLADMFSRVEAIPRQYVLPLLQNQKNWSTLKDYAKHLDELPLGPNVATFIGHSAIRAHVMGLDRSLDAKVKPTREEMRAMTALIEEGLDAGYLGLSINTLTWDKMDGSRHRSKPLPSTFARWSEFRRLNEVLRRRGRVFQGVPNVSTKYNVLFFFAQSTGVLRKKLKTTIISLMDPRSNRTLYRLVGWLLKIFNRVLRADIRLQALPEIFDLYADGVDLVVFEEFGAGTAALHLSDLAERSKLLNDKKYRKWFRRQWTNRFLPRVFHRDFNQSKIVQCPDRDLIGKSFADIAKQRKRHVVDVFLDLCAQYGNDIRWYTVVANDREKSLRYIVSHPDVLIGFSDAGAHLRNMAHYNFPLRLLKMVRDAERDGRPIMPIEKAVWRLTGEIAEWFGLRAGFLREGCRADIAIIDPLGLDESVEEFHEAPMSREFGGLVRLVRRNDRAVSHVFVNGRLAVERGRLQPGVGSERGFGRFLAVR